MKRCSVSLIVIIVVAIAAIAGAISVKFLGNDNVVEQVAEDVIKEETGIDVDVSPEVQKAASQPSASEASARRVTYYISRAYYHNYGSVGALMRLAWLKSLDGLVL